MAMVLAIAPARRMAFIMIASSVVCPAARRQVMFESNNNVMSSAVEIEVASGSSKLNAGGSEFDHGVAAHRTAIDNTYSYCYHCNNGTKVWVEREMSLFQSLVATVSMWSSVASMVKLLLHLKTLGVTWLLEQAVTSAISSQVEAAAIDYLSYLGGADMNNQAERVYFYVGSKAVYGNTSKRGMTKSGDNERYIKNHFAREYDLTTVISQANQSLVSSPLYLFKKDYFTMWKNELHCTFFNSCTGATSYNLPTIMQALIATTDRPAFCGKRGGLSNSPGWRTDNWFLAPTIVDCFETWDT